jgi:RNA polymerase sigma factor (sigma-70 family)
MPRADENLDIVPRPLARNIPLAPIGQMSVEKVHRAIDAVWRIESAKIIASLARIVGDIGIAEDLAQDALLAALEKWPDAGIPDNPAAWLTAAARNRAIDVVRRDKLLERKHSEIGASLSESDDAGDIHAAIDDDIGDDLLRLIFTTCHPVLSTEARVALTLRLLGGLTTTEIARAFILPEPTIAQRIVRAKKTLSDSKVPFELPRGEDRESRLSSVLEVIYLIFNEGYSATSGDDIIRPALCDDALRVGRILAELAPAEAEVHGLVALMEIQASRSPARVDPGGEPVLLLDQNRAKWDQLLIRRGLAALDRANALNAAPGSYRLQAEIAACHARATAPGETDWSRIASLYSLLMFVTPSPVVELNRAVAVSMANGPEAGLEIVDEIVKAGVLKTYHLVPAARGDMLFKLGHYNEAREEFDRAASLTRNDREKQLFEKRKAECLQAVERDDGSARSFRNASLESA